MKANSKYFDLNQTIEKLGIDLAKSFFLCVIAPRNIGKSTSGWNWIIENIWIPSNHNDKVAFCRTNTEKTKYFRNSFNAKYYLDEHKYYMSSNLIYKVEWDDKENKENIAARKEIGSIVTVANEQNFKSGIFKNYKVFFWDEFNDSILNGLYEKFISLLKTVKRNTEPFYILLMGNKVDIGNDILQNLEIDLDDVDKEQIDIRKEQGLYFYNIGKDSYPDANKSDDIVNILATYNENTDNFLNDGGYLSSTSDMVILYKKYVVPTKKPIYNLCFKRYIIEYGIFDGDKVYFHIVRNPNKDLDNLALDTQGYLNIADSFSLWEQDDYLDLANYWKTKRKEQKLFYTTYECMDFLEPFMVEFADMFE